MKSRVEEAIELGRAGRKSAHGGWISRGLGEEKDMDQNLATGQAEGNRWERSAGRRDMAKDAQGAGNSGGQGKGRARWIARVEKKKNKGGDGRVEKCWRPGQHTRGRGRDQELE